MLAVLVCLLVVPRAVDTQSGARRLPAFEPTQEWIQLARSHRVGEADSVVMAAIAKTAIDPEARLLSDHLPRLLDDLMLVRALTRAIVAGGSEVHGRYGVLKMGDLVPLLGMSEREDGFPDRKTLQDPDSPQWRAIAEAMIAVAVLHTDVAMTSPELWGPNRPGNAVDIVDGRLFASIDMRLHYQIARAAVDVALPSTKGEAFARLWYHATAAHLQNSRNYLALMPHLEYARTALPDDARMFLFSGAAFENLAASSVQSVFQQGAAMINLAQPPELLFKAEPLLRRALELDPTSSETRVRLGRVLYLRGRDKDAYPILIKAESEAATPTIKYYAALFAGRAAERMGEDGNAREAYGRAQALFSGVQSPMMALAEMDLRSGNPEAARDNLRMLLRDPADLPPLDPWWMYDVWLAQDAPDLIAQMRAVRASARR
jgi:Flp pilus assembly protein TadD